jgi:hypothetical protein
MGVTFVEGCPIYGTTSAGRTTSGLEFRSLKGCRPWGFASFRGAAAIRRRMLYTPLLSSFLVRELEGYLNKH